MNENEKYVRKPSYLDATNLFMFIIRWKWHLLIIGVLAAVSALIFSGPAFIKPKFKSTVILFPSNTNSVSKALLGGVEEQQDVLKYGEEEQAEQMLQVLNSDDIRDRIIEKFDLMDHYNIDPKGSYPVTRVRKEYESNITFERTEFMSVKIDVMDEDPELAAEIANNISDLLDSMKTKIQRERALQAFKIVEASYNDKVKRLNEVEDSLQILRSKGIFDYDEQSKIYEEEYTKAVAVYENEKASLPILEKYNKENDSIVVNTRARIQGAEAKMKNMKHELDNLAKYGGANVTMNQEMGWARKAVADLRERYAKAKIDLDQSLSSKFVVNRAIKAEKKAYPIRWLIVVFSTLSALFLSVLLLIGVESYAQFKKSKA